MRDSKVRPDLFGWNGSVGDVALQAWLARSSIIGRLPEDLLALWSETGGGDVFETETILGPGSDPALGEDISSVNASFREAGMPQRYLVFHLGLLTTAVDTLTGEYVELLEPEHRAGRTFTALDDWYRLTLREEYADRYGLE